MRWINLFGVTLDGFESVRDSPEGPLKNRGESCLKPAKNAKRIHTAQPTPRWPPRPTRATQTRHPLEQGPPHSRAHAPLERNPPRSRARAPSSGLRLARASLPSSSGVRLARGSLTSAPAPARVHEHLML
jgi:hypothetical protein